MPGKTQRHSRIRDFLSCLALGVATIAAVGTVLGGIQSTQETTEGFCCGDIDLRLTHYPATKDQTQWIKANATKLSQIVQMRVMAKRQDNAGRAPGGTQGGLTGNTLYMGTAPKTRYSTGSCNQLPQRHLRRCSRKTTNGKTRARNRRPLKDWSGPVQNSVCH